MIKKYNYRLVASMGFCLLLFACGYKPHNDTYTEVDPTSNQQGSNEPPLLWENVRKGSQTWSEHMYTQVEQLGRDLVAGAEDVQDFCPQYHRASREERIHFWSFLLSAVAKYESGFDPALRYRETAMGTDPITGQPVYSEGLLQLSYQDIQGYPACGFDWSRDKHLKPTDPNKTILDPYRNLSCGIRILNAQIVRRKRIAVGSGAYWAVLKVTSNRNKLGPIKQMTQSLPYCKSPS